jgi:dienelactone hydrolase
VALALALAGCGGASRTPVTRSVTGPRSQRTAAVTTTRSATTSTTTTSTTAPAPPRPQPPFSVGVRVLTFVDPSRTVTYPGQGPQPRRLVTIVRYPRARGTFPLVIFGHGFAVTPQIYAPLLQAWARAGYVVAAPIFPLGNANAPGGPNETDLVNQPQDMSFVITQMLALSQDARDPFAGLIDGRQVAVSGQSDGGDTALSAAYNTQFLDRRIRAAVILSGAEIPVGGYNFPAPSPPLLATQGLADPINPPVLTYTFFNAAPAPKFLLTLPGASHLGPYTGAEPQLDIVERVTIAFLDRYLKGDQGALTRLVRAAYAPGVAALQEDP